MIYRRYQLLTALITVMCGLLIAGWRSVAAQSHPGNTNFVTIQRSDAESLRFTLRAGDVWQDATGQIHANGLDARIAAPGHPALPYYATRVALPPGAEMSVVVKARNTASVAVQSVAAVPDFVWDEQLQTWTPVPARDDAIYAGAALYPTAVYAVGAPERRDGVDVVTLSIFPVRYAPTDQRVLIADQVEVSITFDGAQSAGAARSADPIANVLNGAAAAHWRQEDTVAGAGGVTIPLGVETFKIEVDEAGIYEITYADLQAAGMDVANVDPNTFEMMTQGVSVAYEFVGDADTAFEANESIRFYGWPYDGTRDQKQHVAYNVFWLWANGAPATITTDANPTGYTPVTQYRAVVEEDPNRVFHPLWTDNWASSDNEPTPFLWKEMRQPANVPAITFTYQITTPFPVPTGADADYLVEILTLRGFTSHPISAQYHLEPSTRSSLTWFGRANRNITGVVPASMLIDGANEFDVILEHTSGLLERTFIERLRVEYDRQLTTADDRLTFNYAAAGTHEFQLSGLTTSDPAQVLAWDTTNRYQPVAIALSAGDITNGIDGPGFTARIARNNAADAEFAVSTIAATFAPVSITEYVGTDLEPAGDGAAWLAISHANFITEVERLATHRAAYSGLSTHVVDVEDVMNQYGYGLPLPDGIQSYIAHAYNDWTEPAQYVLLGGDTTVNPLKMPCYPAFGCTSATWTDTDDVWVPTFIRPIDRFNGVLPVDHFFVTVAGGDDVADLAVGRLAANTLAEMTTMVDKVILYEQNLLTPNASMNRMLFVSDEYDPGAGDFCAENHEIAAHYIPGSIITEELCLPSNSAPDVAALRAEMFDNINITGTLMLNYRGHGGIADWADGDVMEGPADVALWTNATQPIFTLSADCLDGNFAWSGIQGLSELLLRSDVGGSAAHYSSAGLGYSWEHSIMHRGFYIGLFDLQLTAAGDAVRYAKDYYDASLSHPSEMYAFTYQGDPAMQLMRPDLRVELDAQPWQGLVVSDTLALTLTVANDSLLPYAFTVTQTVPSELAITSLTLPAGVVDNSVGNAIELFFPAGLGLNQAVDVSIAAEVTSEITPSAVTDAAVVAPLAVDITPTNNSDSVTLLGETCIDVTYPAGWSIVSLPVAVRESTVASLFPDALSPAYRYESGYVIATDMVPGVGYWIKLPAETTVTYCGALLETIEVPVTAGWNIVAGYERSVNTADITTTPSGIVVSPYYGYDTGYTSATTLEPGSGYWVKISQDGVLELNAP